ncbi:ferrous iron transporter [Endozoicomonas montiporae]|uniref:Ferrous iron transporter n=2 Tax=Endozoicomonas montiporae TaxID=1027273 RepID=A0A081NB20_9GAMM|nr:cation diffusion facilitator family transporter [Endozoicomonas montiporae]AMO56650.1 ferrous iron transporter [Endozoicomonas montiporae CL-33]KEQ15643.1 ferrous iron transporter [Endozoicomonas montiporae]
MDLAQRSQLMTCATIASVATALLLIVVKVIAWHMTSSLSILATLVDSIMDAVASLITLIAVRISLTPADDEHRFGHGKAEYLSVLMQAVFISGSAIILLLQAVKRLASDTAPVVNENIGVAVMVISIAATTGLLVFQRYVVRRTGSTAIAADAMHYKVDLLTNMAVIIALMTAAAGYPSMDSFLTIAIAVYMLTGVVKLVWEAIQHLMDHSLPPEQLEEIERRCLSVPGVISVHEIRTRVSGQIPFIQMHLDLSGELPLREAHDIGYQAKQALLEWLPDADIIVHLDPD